MPKQGNNWTSVRLDRTLLVEAAHDISGRRPRTPPLALPVLVDDWIPIEDLARVVMRGGGLRFIGGRSTGSRPRVRSPRLLVSDLTLLSRNLRACFSNRLSASKRLIRTLDDSCLLD